MRQQDSCLLGRKVCLKRRTLLLCIAHVGNPFICSENYTATFSLEGVPVVSEFIDRPAEMAKLEQELLPRDRKRRAIYVLYGLGGIGKTQLAVEFARWSKSKFDSVFWLDGSSESSLKRSIAACASRIPKGQVEDDSRSLSANSSTDIDAVVKNVLGWLARPKNTKWVLVFDNIDREYSSRGGDADAYDVRRYFSGADHGSILITTRLARLERLGPSQHIGKVDSDQAKAILKTWCKGEIGKSHHQRI